ncbi:MAG: AMP-binding protein [Mollicutes bacterium UO1]
MKLIPILTGDDLSKYSNHFFSPLLTKIPDSNYVFASGGTTGQPKLIYRTHEENELNAQLLAKGLKLGGLVKKDVVANLLPVGKLYAGMLPFNQALEKIGCVILPLGDGISHDLLVEYIKFFKINAILAIPTEIISFAHHVENKKITDIKVARIITGGEQLYSSARQYLKKVLQTDHFQSTGYTSTDTGAIGYQCLDCDENVYHLHSDDKYLEILDSATNQPAELEKDGNIVVTSFSRTLMPIIRYELGDVGRLLKKNCPCGSADQLFELVGRGYERVRVGYTFITPEFVCSNITKIEGLSLHFQIIVSLENYMDKLTIIVESLQKNADDIKLQEELYKNLNTDKDLKEEIEAKRMHLLDVVIAQPNTITRNPRTGKIKNIIDARGQ